MDTVKHYQEIIKQVLSDYVAYVSGDKTSITQDVVAFDNDNRVYTAFNLGWQNGERVQIMLVLMRIVGRKIYVEDDNTDYGFVECLLNAGVPPNDIVLAWQAPEMRQYTEFAVG